MRTLLFFLSIYVIYRLVRLLLRSKVEIKTFHYHDHRPVDERKEGEVRITRIDEKPTAKKKSADDDYVDYEEVK